MTKNRFALRIATAAVVVVAMAIIPVALAGKGHGGGNQASSPATLTLSSASVAAGDAFNPDADSIIHYVEDRARPGSIIAFHLGGPNAPATADALRAIIPSLKARGYKFTTVTGLLALQECGATGPVAKRFLPFSLTPAAWKAPCRDRPPVL